MLLIGWQLLVIVVIFDTILVSKINRYTANTIEIDIIIYSRSYVQILGVVTVFPHELITQRC